VKSV